MIAVGVDTHKHEHLARALDGLVGRDEVHEPTRQVDRVPESPPRARTGPSDRPARAEGRSPAAQASTSSIAP
jgi:hypothetical protein